MNIFWSKALLSTQHSVKLVSYKKGLVLVMVPANFVVEKKFPNMFLFCAVVVVAIVLERIPQNF